jgi:hypothetical protein
MDRKKLLAIFGAVGLLIIVILFIFNKAPEIPSPWQPTTVPYDSKCEGECLNNIQEMADIETSHLRGIKIVVRPDINDEIAQLGDCLDSIMHCVDEKDDPSQTFACVAQSICPVECKESYAKQFTASMTGQQQVDGIETIFLADNAICSPQESGGDK